MQSNYGRSQVTDIPNNSFFNRYNYVDTVCLTEGEETFVKILQTVIHDGTILGKNIIKVIDLWI